MAFAMETASCLLWSSGEHQRSHLFFVSGRPTFTPICASSVLLKKPRHRCIGTSNTVMHVCFAPLAVPLTLLHQSNDVSRLKSRWNQQPASAHTVAATAQRTVPNSAAGYALAAPAAVDSTPPASGFTPLGPGTTPDNDSFQPGSLHLEITPPVNAISRQHYGGSGGGAGLSRGAGAVPVLAAGGISEHPGGEAFERSGKQQQHGSQHRPLQQRRGSSLLHVEPSASCPMPAQEHARGAFGRRQLVFGGRDCATGGSEFGEDYEGQLLGNEGIGVGVGDSAGAVPQEIGHQREWMAPDGGAAGGAVGRASLPVGQDQFFEEEVSGVVGREKSILQRHYFSPQPKAGGQTCGW